MQRQKPRLPLPGKLDFASVFPHSEMRPEQAEAFEYIEKNDGRVGLEMYTGAGKSAIGYAFLKALAKLGQRPLYYVVPTKAQVDQLVRFFPDLIPVYGRNEHQCLYYPSEELKADEIPCLTLINCPHRINVETGAIHTPGSIPCPYYLQKFRARQAQIVVCTMAFYLFHQLFPGSAWEEPAGLVIDEAHRFAEVVRTCLSYEITDYHLWRAADLLEEIDPESAKKLKNFARKMIRIIKHRPAYKPTLLEYHEIEALMEELDEIDDRKLERELTRAVASGKIDPVAQRKELKQLEVIVRDLRRYMRSFEFSLPGRQRNALNYTYGYYKEELGENEKVQYRLVIKAYYVAPLIHKILAPRTLAMSATIGRPEIFESETGIAGPVYTFASDYSVNNTRIFMPTDTKNLAVKARSKRDVTRTLRIIARTCKRFTRAGHRSLVVVISNVEREKFLMLCQEESVNALSYGNGVPAKEVAAQFRDGKGEILVGTAAHYGEGIDLPKQIAPVIFMLRPGYPRPEDPGTIFEERRFPGQQVWALRNWRVMIQALQVRGRNIRGPEDLGVTFFVSQQFRRVVHASLPPWLEAAYVRDKSFEECVQETLKLLKK